MKKVLLPLFVILTMSLSAQKPHLTEFRPTFIDELAPKPNSKVQKFTCTHGDDDSTFTADFENGLLIRFYVNEVKISPDSFVNYKADIAVAEASYAQMHKPPFYRAKSYDPTKMPKNLGVWQQEFKESLELDRLVSMKKSYKIEFGDIMLRINGRVLDDKIYQEYRKQYKDITGVDLHGGYTLVDK